MEAVGSPRPSPYTPLRSSFRPHHEIRKFEGGGNLTFDERRLALKALGFKMFANGSDPMHWRHEPSIGRTDRESVKRAEQY